MIVLRIGRGRSVVILAALIALSSAAPAPDATPATDAFGSGVCQIAPANGQAAITAAIQGCPDGSTVRFPANASYTQSASILVSNRTNLTIDGNGSTFKSVVPVEFDSRDPKPQWRVTSGRSVVLQHMTIVGNFRPTSRAMLAGNQLDHGVEFRGGDGLTVRDATIRNVFGDAVTTVRSMSVRGNALAGVPSRNVTIQRLTVTTAARQCLSMTEQIGGIIEDNVLTDCHYGGIDLEINVGGQVMQDVRVLRNQLHGYTLAGIAVEGAVSPTSPSAPGDMARIEIRGNTVGAGDTCWPAVIFSEPRNDRGPISDVVVAENTLSAQGYGIGVFDVVGGSITQNRVTLTKSKGWCGGSITPVIPVRVERSWGVITSGTTANY